MGADYGKRAVRGDAGELVRREFGTDGDDLPEYRHLSDDEPGVCVGGLFGWIADVCEMTSEFGNRINESGRPHQYRRSEASGHWGGSRTIAGIRIPLEHLVRVRRDSP